MNAIENKNSNHLAVPRPPPPCYSFYDDSTVEASETRSCRPIVSLVS